MPEKTLIIAEKPSVAGDIARALGGFTRSKEFFESDDYVVAAAVGHMLELVAPPGSEVARGKWKLENLPVLPPRFDLQPITKSEARLKVLQKLYRRKDVANIVNACDAGREGELIFHYLIEHFKGKKPIRRLWLQSMTPQAIRDGFENLRDGDELLPLKRAAVCRSESDWLVGINATRAMTALNSGGGGFSLTTVGRVQTPTLAILVDREKEIQNFTPRDYWEIQAKFEIASGQYQARWIARGDSQSPQKQEKQDKTEKSASRDLHGTARPERIWEKARAEAIVAKCANQQGTVSEITKPMSQAAPMLFHLTSLQRESNRRFGFSARATLAIAQALYDRHKALTYPRTDSRALPEDYPPTVKKTMQALSEFAPFQIETDAETDADAKSTRGIDYWAKQALQKKYIRADDKRIFNNARVSDHFAIIPTGVQPRNLKPQEQRVYDLVVRSFIAAFYPPARFENTTRHTLVQQETFETRGRVLLESGWLQVMGRVDNSEILPPLQASAKNGDGESARALELEMEGKQTRPPPRYSEATLLSAMEGAGKTLEEDELRLAMQGRGLGTPATRAAIIEELIRVRYILRDGRELVPMPKATTLLRLLRALKIHELTKAELTGEWESKLKQIEGDAFPPQDFMQHIREMTTNIVEAARGCDVDKIDDAYAVLEAPCPKCGGEVREKYRKYLCQKCDFAVWKSIAGRELTPQETSDLLRDKTSEMLEGFRSRLGREFSAKLVINDEFAVVFDFAEAQKIQVDPEKCEKVGACPKCGDSVLDTPRNFPCVNSLGDKPSCDFFMGRHILSRDMQVGEIRQLITKGKTDLLHEFVSKKNRRKFSAYLTMELADRSGKLGFEFKESPGKGRNGAGNSGAGAKTGAGKSAKAEAQAKARVRARKPPPSMTKHTIRKKSRARAK